jgi:hypothetical protein
MPASRTARHLAAILWPSFLMAGVLEVLVFAMVDPQSLHGLDGAPLGLSAQAVYTLAFLVFWGAVATSGLLTRLLEGEPEHINREGASGAFRH